VKNTKKPGQLGKKLLLNILIIFFFGIMILFLTIPKYVWEEEKRNREDRRSKMELIVEAENFYYELLGEYTEDISELTFIVESTLDSILTDKEFKGNQIINRYTVTLSKTDINLEPGDLIRFIDSNLMNVNEESECFIDAKNGIYDKGEKFYDAKNGTYDKGEKFVDKGNGKYDEGEEFKDLNNNGIWDENEMYYDSLNGKWDEGEEFTDGLNGQYDKGEIFDDINNNGVYDRGEQFIDALNGIYDEGEEFIDELNGKYDEGEEFIDELNGKYDEGEIFIEENGKWDEGESFVDGDGIYNGGNNCICDEEGDIPETCKECYFDGNSKWDEGEKYTDMKNNKYDFGEEFVDMPNGKWDVGEEFFDKGNGKYDEKDLFFDYKNGIYDLGEEFEDELNGQYDEGEIFTDLNNNGVWDYNECYEDSRNGKYDLGEKFIDGNLKYDIFEEEFIDKGNGKYDLGEEFADDNNNGIWDINEVYYDGLNGTWDEGEEFVDFNGNGKWDHANSCICIDYKPPLGCNECYIDGNGVYDEGEDFVDIPNGQLDAKDNCICIEGDNLSNEDRIPEDCIECYVDGNGQYDVGENFVDIKNGVYDCFINLLTGEEEGSECGKFIDEKNNKYDIGEDFTEKNKKYDGGDECICIDGNIPDNCIECYIDGNNKWDEGEKFVDELNGKYDEGENFTDALNDKYDFGEEFTDALDGIYNKDIKGIWAPELYIKNDSNSTSYDENIKFLDYNNNGIWDSVVCFTPIMKIISINENVLTVHNYNKAYLDLNRDQNIVLYDYYKCTGEQLHLIKDIDNKDVVEYKRERYFIDVPLGIEVRIDTTYSEVVEVEYPIENKIYEIEVQNLDNKELRDLIWTNRETINEYDFVNIIQEVNEKRSNVEKNYLRRKYHLDESFIYCPIADDNKNKKFKLTIENKAGSDKQKFVIKAPVDESDNVYKYGIFRYRPGPAEIIDDGIPNWN